MDGLVLPQTPTLAYAALGNAVNVQIAKLVAASLFSHESDREGA
jgi:hypothetical protein